MSEIKLKDENAMNGLYDEIKTLVIHSRNRIVTEINSTLLQTYWEIGKKIVTNEQNHSERAEYGRALLKGLSKMLTKEFGRGFSVSNLQFMRRFYQEYEIQQTLSVKLSWSHYCELLSISDKNKRSFYEKETVNSNWSVRELKRQISTSLYERLLLSAGKENKEKVLELALKGNEIQSSSDIVKDPYVFEFLGLPEEKPIMESDLEKALIAHIENFLLELGKGFMYVGSQQRVTLGNTHYYVDMVFYNKILRSYVLIELKTGKLMPEAVGQLNMYLNYFREEVNDEMDAEPIGIILCTDKENIQAEYALGGISNTIFASRYTLYIPNKEVLQAELEKVIGAYERDKDKLKQEGGNQNG